MGGFESMDALAGFDGIGESTARPSAPEMEDGTMRRTGAFFLHELSDVYDGERRVAEVLPLLAGEVADDGIRTAFREHETETRQQIRKLNRCFEVLGGEVRSRIQEDDSDRGRASMRTA